MDWTDRELDLFEALILGGRWYLNTTPEAWADQETVAKLRAENAVTSWPEKTTLSCWAAYGLGYTLQNTHVRVGNKIRDRLAWVPIDTPEPDLIVPRTSVVVTATDAGVNLSGYPSGYLEHIDDGRYHRPVTLIGMSFAWANEASPVLNGHRRLKLGRFCPGCGGTQLEGNRYCAKCDRAAPDGGREDF